MVMLQETPDIGIDNVNPFRPITYFRTQQKFNILLQTGQSRTVVFNKTRACRPAAERLQTKSARAGKEVKDARTRDNILQG